jgi:UDP-3-O-[3-hydroxymyristoyl] glucosamine N-acyltransferase
MALTLGSLAVRHGCELRGDPAVLVDRVATLAEAGPGAVTFLANALYRSQLGATRASAVILAAEDAAECPVAALVCPSPYLAYARIAAELHPPAPLRPAVDRSASIGEGCSVPQSCQIDPGVVLEADVSLGERVHIGANTVIGAGCRIGADSRILPGSVLYPGVRLGERCLLHSGVVIGADGFGIARGPSGAWTKVPQLGGVVIGNDVEIGANTTIDRGAIGDTVIGDGVKLDNQIQIGHNVIVGNHTAIAAMTGVSGSTRIGARCMIGGSVGFAGHISIADDVVITARANVTNSITRAGLYSGAVPADEARRFRKNAVRFGQLDELARRLRDIERRLAEWASSSGTNSR